MDAFARPGAQGVGHESAAAGAGFGEHYLLRRVQHRPGDFGPSAEELAEDLGHFRGGRKVGSKIIVGVIGGVGAGHEMVEAFHSGGAPGGGAAAGETDEERDGGEGEMFYEEPP